MKKGQLNAVVLNRLLIASLVILVGGAIYACIAMSDFLAARAMETNHAKIDADVGRTELQKLETLKQYLDSHTDDIQRAEAVVAESQQYQYQDQIVQDINAYAKTAGVKVLGFNFPTSPTGAPKVAGGLKTIKATVTLQNPVNYQSFLRFLKLIEQNLTKMQITDISVAPEAANAANVTSPSIGLEVYVR